tara:strand:- start:5450 stop:5701 length:252 start_codon:yes stop_codon:yes gene_type:complete
MNKLCTTLAGVALLAAGSALADAGDTVRTHSLEVKERLQHLERIDVTSELPASPNAEPLDDELLAILEDVERIEQDHGAAEAR